MSDEQQQPTMVRLEEQAARAIAWAHFDRKYHAGQGPRAVRIAGLVDRGWRTFIPAARLVLCVLANEAGKV